MGEALPLLVDLVDRGLIRVLHLAFEHKEDDESIVGITSVNSTSTATRGSRCSKGRRPDSVAERIRQRPRACHDLQAGKTIPLKQPRKLVRGVRWLVQAFEAAVFGPVSDVAGNGWPAIGPGCPWSFPKAHRVVSGRLSEISRRSFGDLESVLNGD